MKVIVYTEYGPLVILRFNETDGGLTICSTGR